MLFFLTAKSQQEKIRLPFKVGNKYMIINENDKEILPAVYDDFRILKDYGIILMVKDGFCGVYDLDGKVILNHNIFCPGKPPYSNMPKVVRVKNGNSWHSDFTTTGLLSIRDNQEQIVYYVNPNKILSVYKPFKTEMVKVFQSKKINYKRLENIFVVENRNKLQNFIDSTGKEIFKESFEHVEFIDDVYIEAGNKGKMAIYKDLNRITDDVYNKSYKYNVNGIIYMLRNVGSAVNKLEKKHHVLFTKTNKIDSTANYPSMLNGYVFFQEEKGFKLYDSLGNIILTHPSYTGDLITVGDKIYIHTYDNNKRGLMALNGEEIFPPTCDIMNDYTTQKLVSRCSSEFVIYDTLLRPTFSMSNVESLRPTKLDNYFIFGLKDGWRTKYGIIDINKKIIIEPKWNEISLATCDSIAYFYSDSITYYQKLSQNNPFLSLPYDTRALVNCEQNRIEYNKDKVYYQYDLNGKLILQLNEGQRQRLTDEDHKYVVKGDQKKYVLQDKNGDTVLPVPNTPIKSTTTTTRPKKEPSGNLNQAVIPEGPPSPPAPPAPIRSDSPYRDSKTITGKSYKDILAIKDNAKNESVYICEFAEKEHPSTFTYNDKLQIVTPKGYSVPTSTKQFNKKNPGTLFVVNDKSATKNHYVYKSGICDYEGKWVIPPFTGYVKRAEEGLFIVEDYDKKAIITYDQKGNRTNDIEFFSIDGDSYSNFFQNRIMVSINADPTYFTRAEKIFKNENDFNDINVALKKIEKLGEPKLIYGFIDTKGKLVLDLKYIKAKPFTQNSKKTIVAIVRNGNIISQIIDTSGHVYLEFEYEDIAELDSTHYMAKKDSLWGITDKNGKALTTFQYTKIYKDKRKPFFQAHKEKKRYLIDSTYTEHYLGEWYSVNTEYLNAHYIVHISTEYGKESDFKDRFIIYNKNFKEVVRFDNIKSIEDNYNGVAIPPNLLYIKKDIDAKNDFFYDLAKGRKLMKE
jgi:hypothetical protein